MILSNNCEAPVNAPSEIGFQKGFRWDYFPYFFYCSIYQMYINVGLVFFNSCKVILQYIELYGIKLCKCSPPSRKKYFIMKSSHSDWFVYMAICSDESIYTGITTDPKRRIAQHNSKNKGARYTRSRQPVKLAYLEKLPDRSCASKREYQLKQLSADQKKAIINSSSDI